MVSHESRLVRPDN